MLCPLNKDEKLENSYPLSCCICRISRHKGKNGTSFTRKMSGGKDKALHYRQGPRPSCPWSLRLHSPPRETACRWHCVQSRQTHCCGPSETPPSQLWICQAGQRRWQNSRLSAGWQLWKIGCGGEQWVSKPNWKHIFCYIKKAHGYTMWIISSCTC